MSELRKKMIKTMELKNFSPKTQRAYLSAVKSIAEFYRKSPDKLTREQIEDYLLFLKKNGKSSSTVNVVYSGRQRYKMPLEHLKVAGAIMNCRTAWLGGHVQRCSQCHEELISYNSCRNRHCPKCQCLTKERWLQARTAELLPTRYFHVIFTLPHTLNPVILTNKTTMLNALFRATADTLMTFCRNNLGGVPGIIAVLHTWDQRLRDHFHLHCLVPAGVLSIDKEHWHHCKGDYLLPVKELSPVFRQKYLASVKTSYKKQKLKFPGQIHLWAP